MINKNTRKYKGFTKGEKYLKIKFKNYHEKDWEKINNRIK